MTTTWSKLRCTEPPFASRLLPWTRVSFTCQIVAVGELNRSAVFALLKLCTREISRLTSNSIKHIGWSASFLLVLLCCGCFQAENPFYRESDIITDKRLEGRFVSATTNSSSTLPDSYVVKPAKNRHYTITYREGDKWAELDAVLFKCGTNLFLDLKKVADNGVNSEPAVGPSSGMEILHIATMADAHCVLRVRFVEDAIQSSGVLHGNPLYTVLQRHRNLKYKTNYKGEAIDPHIRIIANRTEELHALLLAEGSNDDVFGFKGTMFRRKE